jgi:hypothetical protein
MTKKKRLRKEARRAERERQLPPQNTEQGEYVYIIGLGSQADWDSGRGSLYCIEDKNGETVLPVFTTPERLKAYGRANFDTPEAYMQMLESLGANVDTHAPPLQAGRYIIMPVDNKALALAAATIDADYLLRDPRPGTEQEILRLPKREEDE